MAVTENCEKIDNTEPKITLFLENIFEGRPLVCTHTVPYNGQNFYKECSRF